MPKIIVTSHFRKGGKGGKHGSAGGLLKYMGTREGVERLPSDASSKPVTKRQQGLIEAVIKKIPGTIQFSTRNTRNIWSRIPELLPRIFWMRS